MRSSSKDCPMLAYRWMGASINPYWYIFIRAFEVYEVVTKTASYRWMDASVNPYILVQVFEYLYQYCTTSTIVQHPIISYQVRTVHVTFSKLRSVPVFKTLGIVLYVGIALHVFVCKTTQYNSTCRSKLALHRRHCLQLLVKFRTDSKSCVSLLETWGPAPIQIPCTCISSPHFVF